MIYLAEGISFTVHDWTKCLQSKTLKLFAKNMLRNMYNNTELLSRCVSNDKNCKTPNGRNLCTSISPAKDKVIDGKNIKFCIIFKGVSNVWCF